MDVRAMKKSHTHEAMKCFPSTSNQTPLQFALCVCTLCVLHERLNQLNIHGFLQLIYVISRFGVPMKGNGKKIVLLSNSNIWRTEFEWICNFSSKQATQQPLMANKKLIKITNRKFRWKVEQRQFRLFASWILMMKLKKTKPVVLLYTVCTMYNVHNKKYE